MPTKKLFSEREEKHLLTASAMSIMLATSFQKMIEHDEFARMSARPAAQLAKRIILRLEKCIPFLEKIPTDPS